MSESTYLDLRKLDLGGNVEKIRNMTLWLKIKATYGSVGRPKDCCRSVYPLT